MGGARPRGRGGWTAVVIAAAVACPCALAKERLVRQLGRDLGTPPQFAGRIAQDPAGHLWLATSSGLLRYDGVELRRWAPETLATTIYDIAIGDEESFYVSAREREIYRVTPEGAERVPGPEGGGWPGVRNLEIDSRGRPWVLSGSGRVYRRDPAGAWTLPIAGAVEQERVVRLRRDADGILVATLAGVWRVDGDDRLERVLALPGPPDAVVDLLRMPDGALFLCTNNGRVLEHRDGRLTERARIEGRGRALARRADTVWVAGDRGLAAIRPGLAPEHLPVQEHYAQRGLGLLVDREGSLWVANGRGAFQFPEPDTVAWTAGDGLGSGNMRLARTPEGVWVTFWNWGLGIIEERPEGLRARMVGQPADLALCVSGRGTLWGSGKPPGRDQRQLMSRSAEGGFRFHGLAGAINCATAPDGSVWVTSTEGIHHVSASDQVVHLGPARGPEVDIRVSAPREDATGTLWAIEAASTPSLCRAPAAEVRAGRRPVWQCLPLPSDALVEDMVVTPSGAVWIGTKSSGVLRYDGKSVVTLPGSRDLPSSNVHVVEPGRDGSVWLSGAEYLWRVRERTDLAAGWSVEERLGPANGVMADGAFAVIEEEDGTVWATTAAGVIQVPASARAAVSSEPRLHLLRAAVNGRPVGTGQPADVPYGTNDVAVEISPLLFRDPASLLYRVRLAPDASWSAPVRPSRIQLVDVPPGRYGLEVSASRDGQGWTPAQLLFRFAVGSPWYRRAWVWVVMAAGALLAVVLVQRARLGLRLRLERQRTQIALDLHDEMGSGLGSIRVLAGMAARGAVDAHRQQVAAARIERTARDLGQALTGIVWSLRDSGRTLRDLCAHVAERGHELFPEEATAFETAFPAEWPTESLPLQARRNLQLILMEALHNAAKHAQARRVVLGAAAEDGGWRLWVEDDGLGIAPSSRSAGHGLPGMAQRAAAIGAQLEVSRAREGLSGTRVELSLRQARMFMRSAREAAPGLQKARGVCE